MLPCLLLLAARSMFKLDTDDYGLDMIIFTTPTNIKQNQGGLKRARGAQMLDLDPEIKFYPGNNHFLDGFDRPSTYPST